MTARRQATLLTARSPHGCGPMWTAGCAPPHCCNERVSAGSSDTAASNGAAPHPASGRVNTGRAWLRNAMAALAVLAAAAAAVSWDAQYVMVSQVKHTPVIAALEAGVP